MAEFNCRVFGIVTNSEGKVLLLKRNGNYMAHDPDYRKEYAPSDPNYSHIGWELIGGGLEHGEDPKDAVIREYFEEVGITIKVNGLYQARTGTRNGKPLLNIGYICDYVSGEVTLTEEHLDFKWVSKEDLLQVDFGPHGSVDIDLFLSMQK